MKSSQEDIELLETYLKGRLDEASVSMLKARLAAEKQLSDDFKDMQILAEGMRYGVLGDKLSMLKDYEKEMFTMENQKNVLVNKNSQRWWRRSNVCESASIGKALVGGQLFWWLGGGVAHSA